MVRTLMKLVMGKDGDESTVAYLETLPGKVAMAVEIAERVPSCTGRS